MTYSRWLTLTSTMLLAALAATLGLVLLGVSVARDAAFPSLLTSPFSRVMDYPFAQQQVDCEIVVFGDSSAMTADDPRVLEVQTRLKTCNLSQPAPDLAITGTLALDEYLKRNRAPKYLVLQVAPETFYMSHRLDQVAAFDPITLLLRRATTAATIRELSQYPQQTLRYVSVALQDRYRPDRAALSRFATLYGGALRQFDRSHGLMTLATPVQTACLGERVTTGTPDLRWIEEARARYAAMGTKVLVIVSPIPECDAQMPKYRAELAQHVDMPLWTMPVGMFNDGDRHFTLEGAQQVSGAVGRRIVESKGMRCNTEPSHDRSAP